MTPREYSEKALEIIEKILESKVLALWNVPLLDGVFGEEGYDRKGYNQYFQER